MSNSKIYQPAKAGLVEFMDSRLLQERPTVVGEHCRATDRDGLRSPINLTKTERALVKAMIAGQARRTQAFGIGVVASATFHVI
jgi:hypothetical protein